MEEFRDYLPTTRPADTCAPSKPHPANGDLGQPGRPVSTIEA